MKERLRFLIVFEYPIRHGDLEIKRQKDEKAEKRNKRFHVDTTC
jgi:hypothetical protein